MALKSTASARLICSRLCVLLAELLLDLQSVDLLQVLKGFNKALHYVKLVCSEGIVSCFEFL